MASDAARSVPPRPRSLRWASTFSYVMFAMALLVGAGAALLVWEIPADHPDAASLKTQLRWVCLVALAVAFAYGFLTVKARRGAQWARRGLITLGLLQILGVVVLLPVAAQGGGSQAVTFLLTFVLLGVCVAGLWGTKTTKAWFDELRGGYKV